MKALTLAAFLGGWMAGSTSAQVPEPAGYRMEQYRAPVPSTLEGATVVTSDEAFDLWQAGETAFVDVLPQPPRPDNLPDGTIWRDRERQSIPGAVWLPNTGFGELAAPTEAYLRDGLEGASWDDMDHPVLFFCLDDCWMSWNAAKRAVSFGYSNVFWFPGGTDDWVADGHPTERVLPAAPQP